MQTPPPPCPSLDTPPATRDAIERTCAELQLRPPWRTAAEAPPRRP